MPQSTSVLHHLAGSSQRCAGYWLAGSNSQAHQFNLTEVQVGATFMFRQGCAVEI
jgi:hypothetical protein